MRKLLISILIFFLSILIISNDVEAITNRSEIRGLYPADKITDWDAFLQTAKDYNFNLIAPGCVWLYGAMYPSKYAYQFYDSGRIPSKDELALALQAAHSRGIEVHCVMLVFFIWSGFPKDLPIPEDWKAVNCKNQTVNWADPCHPKVRELIKNLTTELATNYDIDGFMFDYIRYDETGYSGQESYSQYCKEWFENDTGIKVTNWPTDVCEGGAYHRQWMEWRVTPITKMVEDVRNWMLAIKPNLEFSAAVFPIFSSNAYAYWRWDIGQDTANWIGKNYLDMVNPMGYTTSISDYKTYISNSTRYFIGTKEGKIPLVQWTTTDALKKDATPEVIKSLAEACREVGCDGWIYWGYGGPGSPTSQASDLRAALQLINLPETFSLGSVKAFPTSTEVTIAWITDKPTTSKVEYSSSPLFIPNYTSGSWGSGFPYWDIIYQPGIVIGDNSNVTTHSITLTNLQEGTTYYFRIQSQGDSGIVTSKVYNFTTGTGSYPITISGRITDSENGLPVKAIVSCNSYGSVSDSNGNYAIRLKSSGSCELTAESFGYKTKKIPISFSGSINQDIVLESVKASLEGRITNKTNDPVNAEIKAYRQGNLVSSTQTDSQGNYNLQLRLGSYDVEFSVPNFLTNFYLRFPSLSILSNIKDKVRGITVEANKISFIADIKTNEIIEINSELKPKKVFYNGTEIGSASSLSSLKPNQWFYDSANKKIYVKLDPYPKTDCIFECCKNESGYYDKNCSSSYYCENRVCKPKTNCPFECCVNEEIYLDKLCSSPYKCFDRKCVDITGYWKFDEGSGSIAYDSSRLGNNGTVYGATWTTDCISGYCLNFDGKDDRVNVPHSNSLNFEGDFTLEAWVKPLGPWTGGFPGVIAKYYPTGYLLGIENSTKKWAFLLKSAESGWMTIHSDSEVEFGKWVHIVALRENGKMKMYINGTLQAETATHNYPLVPTNRFEIGTWDNLRFFNGTIDEVRVYQRALTEQEIFKHSHPSYPECSDGTPYGLCSETKPLYCDNGNLVNNCSYCGCPSEKACNLADNKCYSMQPTIKTFGKTDVGANGWALGANNITGCKFNLPETGALRSVSVYFYSGSGDNYKVAVYDSEGNLKAFTGQRTWLYGKEWGWETFNFSLPILLPAGDYYLTFWGDGGFIVKYGSSLTNQTFINTSIPYNNFPARLVKEKEYNYNISIYANYSPV